MSWIAWLALAAGCGEVPATQVLVRFHVDSSFVSEATEIRVVVRDFQGHDVTTVRDLDGLADTLVATVPVVPHDASSTFRVSAELVAGDAVIGRKLVMGRYTADELREVNVWFDAECRSVLDCESGRTCEAGSCVGACFEPTPIGEVPRNSPTCSSCQSCLSASCAQTADGDAPEGRSCGCPGDRCTSGTCTTRRVSRLSTNGGVPAGASVNHTCALTENNVYCWGSNRTRQAGGPEGEHYMTPTMVLEGAQAIGTGREHTCAVALSGGGRWCWGYGGAGNVSADLTTAAPTPGMDGEPFFVDVAAGWIMTVALGSDGRVYTWGTAMHNVLGRRPLGDDQIHAMPAPIEGEGFTAIAAGGLHACALDESHALFCWGLNEDAEVGNESLAPLASPARATMGGAPLEGVDAVAVGEFHTCVIRAGGELLCVGKNDRGQLGLGFVTNGMDDQERDWRRVDGAWRAVDGGDGHTCAIDVSGRLFCWGDNSAGELGIGNAEQQLLPVEVHLPGGGEVAQVDAGFRTTCAVRRNDGAVFCWGDNGNGFLGVDSTAVSITRPARVCLP